jgi:hypothetical protein
MNTVSLRIADPQGGPPTLFENIPWFPGMTILEAMIIAQGMYVKSFSFQVEYHSFYGAFANAIDGTVDQGSFYWIVQVDGNDSPLGISEAILQENPNENVEVEWQYRDTSKQPQTDQVKRKLLATQHETEGGR